MVRRTVLLRTLSCCVLLSGAGCPSDRVAPDQPVLDGADPTAGSSAGSAASTAGVGAAGASATGQAGDYAGVAGSGAAAGSSAVGSAGAAGKTVVAEGGTAGRAAGSGGSAAGGPAAVGGAGGGAGSSGAQDPECDMNGIWIARLTTFSRDSIFGATQTASNWFYYEVAQTGRTLKITHALNCGIQVSGSADVTLNSATTQALMHPNDQTGRMGEFYRDGDHCTLKIERFYSVRGASRAIYLPADTSSNPELSSITPMLPTEQMPTGAEDWDGDGNPGIAFNVSGLGSRHVVQRDWNEYASDADHTIALSASEFIAGAHFDNQEQILAVTGGLGALLKAGSTPALDLEHRVKFRMLGRSVSDPTVAQVRLPDDLDTCFKVQDALPHDKASQ